MAIFLGSPLKSQNGGHILYSSLPPWRERLPSCIGFCLLCCILWSRHKTPSSFVLSGPQVWRVCWVSSVFWDRQDRSQFLRQPPHAPKRSHNIGNVVQSFHPQEKAGSWEFSLNHVALCQREGLWWDCTTNYPTHFSVAGFTLVRVAGASELLSRVFIKGMIYVLLNQCLHGRKKGLGPSLLPSC